MFCGEGNKANNKNHIKGFLRDFFYASTDVKQYLLPMLHSGHADTEWYFSREAATHCPSSPQSREHRDVGAQAMGERAPVKDAASITS